MFSLRSSRVVVEGEVRPATITISDGVIVSLGEGGGSDHDFDDLVVMPGLVDSHVHVNQPGRTEWEGFATATQAALAGGCTTIVDMPLNSVPPTVTVGALEEKQRSAGAEISCDLAFWGGFVGPTDALATLVARGVCGFKAFLSDSGVEEFPPVAPEVLGEAMGVLAGLGVPMLVHAEDPAYLDEVTGDPGSYRSYLASRPVEAEVSAVSEVAERAAGTGAMAHILHVSSGEAAELIGRSRLSGETCPHYLTFAAEEVADGATEFKCAPPIREAEHREALWDALFGASLDMVVSDHSPSPPALKEPGNYSTAWGGISSLQLRLPATWTGAAARGGTLADLTRWLSSAPARLAGLDDRKGEITVGADADLVVWDPDDGFVVDVSRLGHRHPISPYQGMHLRGKVAVTFLGGEPVYSNGAMTAGRGRMQTRR